MCTVGSCFIRSKEGYAKDVLKDMAEMCKGVQHPTRGLFLRSYLCQVSKGLLPDVGSPYEGEGGTIHDALDFLLLNFTEMNKLWVRMQVRGAAGGCVWRGRWHPGPSAPGGGARPRAQGAGAAAASRPGGEEPDLHQPAGGAFL